MVNCCNVHQTKFNGRTNPILRTVLEEMEMMADPSNLMSKFMKVFTADRTRKMFFKAVTVLQHR